MLTNRLVILSLGSNLGDSSKTILEAYKKITELEFVRNAQRSALYKTTPVSGIPQGDYVNMACSFESTCLDPFQVLEALQEIERLLGKSNQSMPRNSPRYIDIDILLFQHQYIQTEKLQIPHPRMLERLFVLQPLSDIADEVIYPTSEGQFSVISIPQSLKYFKNTHNEIVKKMAC